MVGNTTGGNSLIVQHGDLSYWGNMVSNESSMFSNTYEYAISVLTDLHKMCRQMNQLELGEEHTSNGKNKMVSDAVSEVMQLIESPHATTKGRPKRLKSSKEKTQKKQRLCRGCNQRGVSHDKRNCPALLNRGIVDLHVDIPRMPEAPSDTHVEGSSSDGSGSDVNP